MSARALNSPPRLLPLYLRSAAPMIPGASLLPFVPGHRKDVPEIELRLDEVHAEAAKVAAYAKVCGFSVRKHLPITYPHVLAFPLHMAVMADGRFPFGAVGLVHIENRILQRRPIAIGEPLTISVSPTGLSSHPRGRAFTLVTRVSVGDEVVWEGFSTMLRRGGGTPSAGEHRPGAGRQDGLGPAAAGEDVGPGEREAADRQSGDAPATGLRPSATWRLQGDLGRRYAAVSGDRNPIHMHPLSAKLFGFPGAIAHGMWSKARCLAALESRLPDAFEAQVRFRKPIVLPAKVEFATSLSAELESLATDEPRSAARRAAGADESEIHFSLSDAKRGTPHLDGIVTPAKQIERSRGK